MAVDEYVRKPIGRTLNLSPNEQPGCTVRCSVEQVTGGGCVFGYSGFADAGELTNNTKTRIDADGFFRRLTSSAGEAIAPANGPARNETTFHNAWFNAAE